MAIQEYCFYRSRATKFTDTPNSRYKTIIRKERNGIKTKKKKAPGAVHANFSVNYLRARPLNPYMRADCSVFSCSSFSRKRTYVDSGSFSLSLSFFFFFNSVRVAHFVSVYLSAYRRQSKLPRLGT